MEKKKEKNKKKFPVLALAAVILCLGALGFAASKVLEFYKPDIEAKHEIQELIDAAVTTAPPQGQQLPFTAAPAETAAEETAYATEQTVISDLPYDTAQPTEAENTEAYPSQQIPSETEAPQSTPLPTAQSGSTASPTQGGSATNPALTNTPVSTAAVTSTPAYSSAPAATQQPAAETPHPTQPGASASNTPKPTPAPTNNNTTPKPTPAPTSAPSPNPTPAPTQPSGPASPLVVDFNELQSINPDICAWLYSPNTPINYPVMYSSDNLFYLDHLYNGQHSSGGSLFVDYRCSRYFTDINTLIFGHNNQSGSMFGTLKKYKKQSYYNEHPYMWLYTPGHAYRLDLIAGLITLSNSEPYTLFTNVNDLHSFLRNAKADSTFDSGFDPDSIDQVVTLSTCTYEFDHARYVVIGHPVKYY